MKKLLPLLLFIPFSCYAMNFRPPPEDMVDKGLKLLWALVQNNSTEALKYLDETTANTTCKSGFSALHYATLVDNVTMVKQLIAYGADTQQKNHSGNTAFLLAARYIRQKTFAVLLKYATHDESIAAIHLFNYQVSHKKQLRKT